MARVSLVQLSVGYTNTAVRSTRAPLMQLTNDILITTDKTKVSLDAAAHCHTSVEGRGHQYDIVVVAFSHKLLVMTVLFTHCSTPQTTHSATY